MEIITLPDGTQVVKHRFVTPEEKVAAREELRAGLLKVMFDKYYAEQITDFASLVGDNAWAGRRCFIVGSGTSLDGFDWSKLNGELTIATNHTYKYFNPTIIASIDFQMINWLENGTKGINGEVCTKEERERFWGLRCLRAIIPEMVPYDYPDNLNMLLNCGNEGFSKSLKDGVFCGKNSGYAALNIAVLLGANPIYLLGFDMQHGEDGRAHFYDKKPSGQRDLYRERFLPYFAPAAPLIKARGQHVVNLSNHSALDCFEFGKFPPASKRPVYVACYTLDSPYVEEVNKLAQSLTRFGLPYDLWPYESRGSWEANCSYISTVCREAMEKYYSGRRPIVFLGADTVICNPPTLLENMPHDVDFAACYLEFFPGCPEILNSTCLYFAPTSIAYDLVRNWESLCKGNTKEWDQRVLQRILDDGYFNGKFLGLPGTYCKVYDNDRQPNAADPPVVWTSLASRRFKTEINKKVEIA